jgi:hypothetical protein
VQRLSTHLEYVSLEFYQVATFVDPHYAASVMVSSDCTMVCNNMCRLNNLKMSIVAYATGN